MKKNKILKVLSCSLVLSTALGFTSCKKKDNPITDITESSKDEEQIYQNVSYTEREIVVKVTDENKIIDKCFFYAKSSINNTESSYEMIKNDDGSFTFKIEKPEYNNDAYSLTDCYIIYIKTGSSEQNRLTVENIDVKSITGTDKVQEDEKEKEYIETYVICEMTNYKGSNVYKLECYDMDGNQYGFECKVSINGGKANYYYSKEYNITVGEGFKEGKNLLTLTDFKLVSDKYKTDKTHSCEANVSYDGEINCSLIPDHNLDGEDKTVYYNTSPYAYNTLEIQFSENMPYLEPSKVIINGKNYSIAKNTFSENNKFSIAINMLDDLQEGTHEYKVEKIIFETGYEIDVNNVSLELTYNKVAFNVTSNLEKYCKRSEIENGGVSLKYTIENPYEVEITKITIEGQTLDCSLTKSLFECSYTKKVEDTSSSTVNIKFDSISYKIGDTEYTYDINYELSLSVYDMNTNFTVDEHIGYYTTDKADEKSFEAVIVNIEHDDYTDIKPYRIIENNGIYEKEYCEDFIRKDGKIYLPLKKADGKYSDWVTKDEYDNYTYGFSGLEFYIGDEKVATEGLATGYATHFRLPYTGTIADTMNSFSYIKTQFAVDHETHYIKSINTDGTVSYRPDVSDNAWGYLTLEYNEGMMPFTLDEYGNGPTITIHYTEDGKPLEATTRIIGIPGSNRVYTIMILGSNGLKVDSIYQVTGFDIIIEGDFSYSESYSVDLKPVTVQEFSQDYKNSDWNESDEYVPPVGETSYNACFNTEVIDAIPMLKKDTTNNSSDVSTGENTTDNE